MAKWADYAIYSVRFNPQRTHIDQVRAFPDNGTSLGASVTFTRQEVIIKIAAGTTFVTTFLNNTNQYNKGSDVFVVRVGNDNYIKTVRDNTTRDNLDKLPEF